MPGSVRFSASWRRCRPLLVLVLLCAATGLAQAQRAASGRADPPSRVARLSYIAGDLGFLPAGAKAWSDANINRPLTTGDKLSTARGGRAELEFGGGTLRIDGRTDTGLLDLDDQLAQIELTRGTLSLTVRRLDHGQSYEIDTPTVALVVDRPGTFRVDVDDRRGDTQVTAFDGGATVYGENNAQRTIRPGRSYEFADASLATVTITDVDGGDAFDDWASRREQRYARSSSRRYVSEEVVGYQDLDRYGSWRETREYGAVWYPADVAVDWAPYRSGHWAYIAPWGWTWVDDAPWGFAPYHYGRWAWVGGGWGWIPGPVEVRPVYAPALVAFVGGGGWSVGMSFGSAPVGWFPLGPGEVYNPWYRCDRSYYTRVNVTNIYVHNTINRTTVINNIDNQYNYYRSGRTFREASYANRMAPHGFTAMPGNAFADGGHVQRDLIRVDPRKLADAPVLPHGADRAPPPVDRAPPPRSVHARELPVGGFDRAVVARHAPPAVAEDAPIRGGRFGQAREIAAPANVRLLDARPAADAAPHPLPGVRAGNEDRPMPARMAELPAANRVAPADDPAMQREPQPELRSARFAHPRGRNDDQPRPGVSYIAPARDDARPATEATLPRAPRFERTAPTAQDMPPRELPSSATAERMPRRAPMERPMRGDEPAPAMSGRPAGEPRFQRPEPTPRFERAERTEPTPRFERAEPAPRFERPEPAPRGFVREEARPAPAPMMRREPAPQPQPPPQPAYQQMQRYSPPPAQQAPQPQRGEPRQAPRKYDPHEREDRQPG